MVANKDNLIFKKLENSNIFTSKFQKLDKNNTISFSKEGIAVLYGPNGTGKTSLINTLCCEEGTSYILEYGDKEYSSPDNCIFSFIHDQNHRNIIKGTENDFLLGDNIHKEFELKDFIHTEYNHLCSELNNTLKRDFDISTKDSKLIQLISDININKLVSDIANTKSKGKKYEVSEFIDLIKKITPFDIPEYNIEKLSFLKKDYLDKNSIILKICLLDNDKFVQNGHARVIEENTEAIKILKHFNHKTQCIVCDTPDINPTKLLKSKKERKENAINTFSKEMIDVLEKIISLTPENDPFKIKDNLLVAIDDGNINCIISLKKEIQDYSNIYNNLIENAFHKLLSESQLPEKNKEYKEIINTKLELDSEDILYIEEIINNSMEKELKIERDKNRNIKIYLSQDEFLGKDRKDLPLSAGEQNFLSLTFEFLKAKKSKCQIIVLDDPISSFDSIYKNKIIYAIIRMLRDKKRLILTHNIDLIRLLDAQYKKCFRLYLFNNTSGESNGFIPLKFDEQDILINLNKLLETFRENVFSHIKNVDLYLMSMIPFMRGYAQIINNKNAVDNLTDLMHGYKSSTIDIASLYHQLFKPSTTTIPQNYSICVNDILITKVDGIDILDTNKYPLLERTLKHTFNYLFLRLYVEKNLVSIFNVDTSQYKQLGQIIDQSFPENKDLIEIRNRVRLTSKKTLINEFNHFEGNLSIFQPAIDITDSALNQEKKDIIDFIEKIKNQKAISP